MPCITVASDGSPFYNFMDSAGGIQNNKALLEWQQGENPCHAYGIPEGCVVRNTFLEWQECGGDGAYVDAALAPRVLMHRRALSCPEDLVTTLPSTLEEVQGSRTGSPSTPCALGRPHLVVRANSSGDCECYDNSPLRANGPSRSIEATSQSQDTRGDLRYEGSQNSIAVEKPLEEDASALYAGGRSPNNRNQKSQKNRANGTSLVLRGLPFNVSEDDVAAFIDHAGALQDLAPGKPIVLLNNAQGRPSGFAEVNLNRAADFWQVRQKLHMQRLGGRYIEALPPRNASKSFGGTTPSSRHNPKLWRRQM